MGRAVAGRSGEEVGGGGGGKRQCQGAEQQLHVLLDLVSQVRDTNHQTDPLVYTRPPRGQEHETPSEPDASVIKCVSNVLLAYYCGASRFERRGRGGGGAENNKIK
eukprot:CAMPEP_0197578826 /NCGR_PEP_ID=MMETSP1326-20131121/2945_1 /TAXON_ID=1155430 /ORGANISM="Genus nov. species nov., Strain RCC2288" /LENGTH=105 /DNA_ID=CAMNT_0043142099 /DNA_START=311 /DNA_END=629 /DNA_ORIENTATION=-